MIDLATVMHQCAPSVAPSVLEAIIRTESGFDPLALHINGPMRLRSRPKTAAQAASWSSWLIRQGYSVDMGLMQINSRNLVALDLTPEGAFDPCRNVRAGAALLTTQYNRAKAAGSPGAPALLQALSAYNTGSFQGGFRNGYVAKILMHDFAAGKVPALDLACLLAHCSPRPSSVRLSVLPYAADTAVGGFGASP